MLLVTYQWNPFRINKYPIAVSTSTHSSSVIAAVRLPLDSFNEAASQGKTVHVHHDGSSWEVAAQGMTSSGRAVTWVKPDSKSEFDTTLVFLNALEQRFSRGIQVTVARVLGLKPAPGQPLASRSVKQAIAMAETIRTTMNGVDCLTQLMSSAAANSGSFKAACAQAGLSPAAFSKTQRKSLDAAMQQHFQQAADQGQSPVAPKLAQQWLRAELAVLSGQVFSRNAADPVAGA